MFGERMRFNERVLHPLSIREVLAWASFIRSTSNSESFESCVEMFLHGACMTLVDSLGLGNQLVASELEALEENAGGLSEGQQTILAHLLKQLESGIGLEEGSRRALQQAFGQGGFAWARGP